MIYLLHQMIYSFHQMIYLFHRKPQMTEKVHLATGSLKTIAQNPLLLRWRDFAPYSIDSDGDGSSTCPQSCWQGWLSRTAWQCNHLLQDLDLLSWSRDQPSPSGGWQAANWSPCFPWCDGRVRRPAYPASSHRIPRCRTHHSQTDTSRQPRHSPHPLHDIGRRKPYGCIDGGLRCHLQKGACP